MFDYNLWGPILGLLIAALALIPPYYTAFFQRNQPMATTESPASTAGSNITQSSWWKSRHVIALFVLCCSLWGPYILSRLSATTQIHSAGLALSGQADMFDHFLNATMTIYMDGNEIYKYQPKKAMAVAFHWPTDRDVDDTEDLQKSQVLDIRKSSMTFFIKPDQKFIDLLNHGSGINYSIIILPTDISANSFSTMRQAKKQGAEILPAGSGGISLQLQRVR